jgi:toluene monooxygenase system ferredoxin subunit
MAFVPAAKKGDLWPGEMRGIVLFGKKVLLVNVDGDIRAYEDRCAHQGARLSEGKLEGGRIVCPLHEWTYDACTGCGANPPSVRLRAFPVRIEADEVCVDVAEASDMAVRR